ncbi:MAG TPA: hypothetical protein VJB59_02800 [Bdellovibrionota bacterium]|nr:hypothetical protein [Bdellovibrionota bacterium]
MNILVKAFFISASIAVLANFGAYAGELGESAAPNQCSAMRDENAAKKVQSVVPASNTTKKAPNSDAATSGESEKKSE